MGSIISISIALLCQIAALTISIIWWWGKHSYAIAHLKMSENATDSDAKTSLFRYYYEANEESKDWALAAALILFALGFHAWTIRRKVLLPLWGVVGTGLIALFAINENFNLISSIYLPFSVDDRWLIILICLPVFIANCLGLQTARNRMP